MPVTPRVRSGSIRLRRSRPSAMRSPPPASSPRSSTCGARAGDRGSSISYFTASWPCSRRRAPHSLICRASTPTRNSATRLVARVRDPITARFWIGEYPQYDERYRAEAAGPILNKVGQLAASPALRAMLGQHAPKFDLSYAMEHHGILIANLAKGRIGEQAANLLGSLLVSHLQLAAMGRSAQAPENRVPFFAHIDEFQSFGTDAFASLLSEARKFAAHFCLANQYIDQLDASVRAAVLGNAGALLVFRVSGHDAMLLAPEFDPLPPSTLVDQAPFTAWLRRGIGHEHVDLLPRLYEPRGRLELIRRQSRRNFGRPRELVEQTFDNSARKKGRSSI